jgi:mycothiol synthase
MDDEVDGFGAEAVVVGEVAADTVDEVTGVVVDGAADTAHQMKGVVGVVDLPAADPLAELDLTGESELGQQGQTAVDAGEVDVRGERGDLVVDLLGGEVLVGAAQGVPDQLALRGQAVALVVQSICHVHWRHHDRMLRIELRTTLDQRSLDEICALIEQARAIEGHAPVGEHKLSHLAVGARDWVGILAYDGEGLVGYAHTRWNPPQARPRMAVEVVVHPEWHGTDVARRLLDETRAVLARAGGGLLYLWVHWVDDPATTLAARMGFAISRELAFMAKPLDFAPAVELPEGLTLRGYRAQDAAAFLAVNNAAFAGHPENGGWSPEDFAQRRELPWFDPEGLLLAWRGEELLGFHWTKWHGHEAEDRPAHEPVGEVYVLGIAPQAQGLGLGRALLHAGLVYLYERGCRRVILYVDRASEGARRLYESDGFVTESLEVCYTDEVAPVTERPSADLLRPA